MTTRASSRWHPPPGACDCHFHVFGPYDRFPLAPRRSYTPSEAGVGAYRALMTTLGLDRCVIVQPSVYGTDNSCTLAAAGELGLERCRSVGVIDAATPRSALAAMHGAGMRGVRINAVAGGGPGVDEMRRLAAMIAPFGWHLQLFLPLDALAAVAPVLETLPADIVIDHMGAPGAAAWAHPGVAALLRLLSRGRTWIKLSGAYLGAAEGAPWPEMGRLARALAAERPDRLLWGSNWPHPVRSGPVPDDGDILDALHEWLMDPAVLRAILVGNPEALYGFTPARTGHACG